MINRQQKPSIEEWALVYSPKNNALDDLIGRACVNLNLTGCFGVENATYLEATFATRKLLAGVAFLGDQVIIVYFLCLNSI